MIQQESVESIVVKKVGYNFESLHYPAVVKCVTRIKQNVGIERMFDREGVVC